MTGGVAHALRNKESDTTDKGYERALTILDAAKAILAAEGYAGLTMRSVASRVGVSLSTVQHYYPSKDALVEALLVQTFDDYQAAIDRRIEKVKTGSRLDQFEAVIDYFLDELRDPLVNVLIFELSSLATRHAFARQVLDTMLTRARKTVRNLVRAMSPQLSAQECEVRGALIVSQLQGLMLYMTRAMPQHRELAGLRAHARAAMVRMALEPAPTA